MTSDPIVIDLEGDGSSVENKATSLPAARVPASPIVVLTPRESGSPMEGSDFFCTPSPAKRAGSDISNLPVSTPKRVKHIRVRRSPAEVAQEKEEKELKRTERLKAAEEARLRKEDELKKKEEARLEREKARQLALKQKQEEKERKEEERRKRDEEKVKKDEEKQKKDEEKQKKDEEKRKREEERKAAEGQKQKELEAKTQKQQKVKNQFLSFFKSPEAKAPAPRRVSLISTSARFHEFQCQPGMTLAPVRRREPISDTSVLDRALGLGSCDSPLYLAELAERVKGQCLRSKPSSGRVTEPGMQPKLLQFCKNTRPPYWGTWRKKSTSVRPRNPFGQDKVLDYEYDSDDDWEEEEPGESLSHSEGEDKEEGEEDDDDDDGFFVPHGYLSDDEQGGSDADHGDLDPSAAALLRKVTTKVGRCSSIAGPELLAKFQVVPLVSYCPVNPLAFAFPAAAPMRRVA